MTKPSVYIETSVVSYLTARRARDLIVLAHQEITTTWWGAALRRYKPFVSQLVLDELRRGDPVAAARRLEAIAQFHVLEQTDEVLQLAGAYLKNLNVPSTAAADCVHIAYASVFNMDFIVTWNCKHIANGSVIRDLMRYNERAGLSVPVICTPEELEHECG